MRLAAAVLAFALLAQSCVRAQPTIARDACSSLQATNAPLEFVVLGSGGPRSVGRAASAFLIRVAGVPRALVDIGPGAFLRLGELDVDFDRLDTVLLTHLHIDHAGDVAAFVKSRDLSYRRPLEFNFYGPTAEGEYPATSEFVGTLFGTQGAFRYLPGFRNTLDLRVTDVPVSSEPRLLFERDGLKVTAITVDHGDVPALAFRVDAGGRSIVVTGDLASRTDALVTLAKDADLLVYDAAVLDPPAAPPILYELHTSPSRIGQVASQAGVATLLLSHLTPSVTENPEQVRSSIRSKFAGPIDFAFDCQRVTVEQHARAPVL